MLKSWLEAERFDVSNLRFEDGFDFGRRNLQDGDLGAILSSIFEGSAS